MNNLSDVVQQVISDFIQNDMLFTALDVTNKVKETMPFSRHREVRDLVRSSFHTNIESAGYARTPVNVTLNDGSVTEALLYHPLSDSWDLDNKYDLQKRAQTTLPANLITASKSPVIVINTATPAAPIPASTVPTVSVIPTAKDVWQELFKSQPSLFVK